MSQQKQRVLILGATGQTGSSVVDALLEDGEFNIEAFIRPASAEKKGVLDIKKRGVKIVIGELNAAHEELVALLKGVDVVISTIDGANLLSQIQLATAAKEAGVKRFIPCSWATTTPPGGVMDVRDVREKVYQHIRKIFLPYTVIDVGFWYQLSFPSLPSGRVEYASVMPGSTVVNAGGEAPNLLTDLRDVGRFLVKIIKDERTLNKSVFTYGDVLSENQIFALMEELSGEKIEKNHLTAENLHDALDKARKQYEADPSDRWNSINLVVSQYAISKYIRLDNTPEYAKYLGYIDARELYPDFKPITFREFVGELLEGKIIKPYSQFTSIKDAFT